MVIQTWAGDWELVMLVQGADGTEVTLANVTMSVAKPALASPASLMTRLPKGALLLLKDPAAQLRFGLRRRGDEMPSIRMASPNLAMALLALIHDSRGDKQGVLRIDAANESVIALVQHGDHETPSSFTPVAWSDIGCEMPILSAVMAWAARAAVFLDLNVELKT